jgi:hypothetical protein
MLTNAPPSHPLLLLLPPLLAALLLLSKRPGFACVVRAPMMLCWCTALHFTVAALHCGCTALHRTALHRTALYCSALSAQVAGACIWAALISRYILPWYMSDAALEAMATAFEHSAVLFQDLYNSQYQRMRVAAALVDAEAKGAADSSGGAVQQLLQQMEQHEAQEAQLLRRLRQDVLKVLVDVQLLLEVEGVSWRTGMLATPQVKARAHARPQAPHTSRSVSVCASVGWRGHPPPTTCVSAPSSSS